MYTLREAVRSIPKFLPGFEFHPTDHQLISYYLKKKCQSYSVEPDMIPVIDIYQNNPWTLPDKCGMQTSYNTWHFFVPQAHSDRATETGHWELSSEREIKQDNRVVGNKKTYSFFYWQGVQTEWVVDEYHLQEDEYIRARENNLDCFILCRISKSEQPDEEVQQNEEVLPEEEVHQNEEVLPEEVLHQNEEVLLEDLEQSENDVNNDNASNYNYQPQEDVRNWVDQLTDQNFDPNEVL